MTSSATVCASSPSKSDASGTSAPAASAASVFGSLCSEVMQILGTAQVGQQYTCLGTLLCTCARSHGHTSRLRTCFPVDVRALRLPRHLAAACPRRWRAGLHQHPKARRQIGVRTVWAKVRQIIFAWWIWAIAAIVALVYDNWGWAIGTGLMSAFAFLAWPSEVPPRVGLDHEFCVDDDEFLTTMAGSTGIPFFEGNAIEILNNGDEFYPAMLKSDRAGAMLGHVEAYIYWAGEIGRRFAEALAAKAKAGVGVKILLDAVGSSTIGDEILEILEKGGCQLAWYNPVRPVQHRPLQSPDPPEVAHHRRAGRVHRRRRHRRPLDGSRAGRPALARYSDPHGRTGGGAAADRLRAKLAAGDRRDRLPGSSSTRRSSSGRQACRADDSELAGDRRIDGADVLLPVDCRGAANDLTSPIRISFPIRAPSICSSPPNAAASTCA